VKAEDEKQKYFARFAMLFPVLLKDYE